MTLGLTSVVVNEVAHAELLPDHKCGKTTYYGCDLYTPYECLEHIGYNCVQPNVVSGCKRGILYGFKLCISGTGGCLESPKVCYRDIYYTDYFCYTCGSYCNAFNVTLRSCDGQDP